MAKAVNSLLPPEEEHFGRTKDMKLARRDEVEVADGTKVVWQIRRARAFAVSQMKSILSMLTCLPSFGFHRLDSSIVDVDDS